MPLRLLEGYRGYVMTDDYAGYSALALQPGVERLACMAHTRRKFVEARHAKGATGSAQVYSLVETAKVNGQKPYTWLRHVLERLSHASSVEDYEALQPWNCSPEMPR